MELYKIHSFNQVLLKDGKAGVKYNRATESSFSEFEIFKLLIVILNQNFRGDPLSLLFQLSLFFPSKLMRYLRNVKYAILNAQAALHHSCRPSFVTKDRTVKCDNDKNGLHSGFYIANQRIVLLGRLNTKIHFGTKSPNQVI